MLFRHGYNDTTNAFKAYRREVIDTVASPLEPLQPHRRASAQGDRPWPQLRIVPISWTNRKAGVSKLKLQEMGSRYSSSCSTCSSNDTCEGGLPPHPPEAPSPAEQMPLEKAELGAVKDHISSSATLDEIYGDRFSDSDARAKDAIWKEITKFLQRYIPADASVWTSRVIAATSSATSSRARSGRPISETCPTRSRRMFASFEQTASLDHILPVGYFDVAFMSNYFEHLGSSDNVLRQLEVTSSSETGRARRHPSAQHSLGRRALLGFHRPLRRAHRAEPGRSGGAFRLRHGALIVRFLPYTTKSRLPRSQR